MVPANFDFWLAVDASCAITEPDCPDFGTFRGNPGRGWRAPSFEGNHPSGGHDEAIASRSTSQERRPLLLMKTFAAKLSTLAALVAVTCLCFGAVSALACGVGGYSYAGLGATAPAFGIGATVTPLSGFDVVYGHVAGWVGVGGPHQGPNRSDEWLQVGFIGFPELTGNNLYYELTLPNRPPTYHQLATNLPMGKAARFAVLEMQGRPDWWRVWLNGSAASKPIYMPGSHRRWAPIATAESWDGGTAGACNGFLYRFHKVSIAQAPGGRWQQLVRGYAITGSSTRIERSATQGAFLAAEGNVALRTLASLNP